MTLSGFTSCYRQIPRFGCYVMMSLLSTGTTCFQENYLTVSVFGWRVHSNTTSPYLGSSSAQGFIMSLNPRFIESGWLRAGSVKCVEKMLCLGIHTCGVTWSFGSSFPSWASPSLWSFQSSRTLSDFAWIQVRGTRPFIFLYIIDPTIWSCLIWYH